MHNSTNKYIKYQKNNNKSRNVLKFKIQTAYLRNNVNRNKTKSDVIDNTTVFAIFTYLNK